MVKKQIISVGLFVVSVLFAAVAVFIPAVSFPSVFAAGLACAFSVIFSTNPWVLGIGSVLSFVLVWIISGSASAALLFLILFLPIGAALGLGFKNKMNFNDSIAFAALNGAVLGVIALLVFVGEFSDGSFDAKTALEPVFLNMKELLLAAFDTDEPSVAVLFDTMKVSAEQYVNNLYYNIVYNIPTFYMCFILCISVLSYWVIKAIFKRTEVQIDFMGIFDDCRIGRTGAFVYSIATILYFFASNTVFGIVLMNFFNVMTYVLAYAGISFIAYLLDFKKVSSFVKNAVIIVAFALCLLPMGPLTLVAFLGFLDSCWNIRERLQNSGF